MTFTQAPRRAVDSASLGPAPKDTKDLGYFSTSVCGSGSVLFLARAIPGFRPKPCMLANALPAKLHLRSRFPTTNPTHTVFWGKVLLHNPDWPKTPYIDQPGLELAVVSCLCLPGAGVAGMSHLAWLSCLPLEIQFSSLYCSPPPSSGSL